MQGADLDGAQGRRGGGIVAQMAHGGAARADVVQAGRRADPERAGLVAGNGVDGRVTEGRRRGRHPHEAFAQPVVHGQPCRRGADPQAALGIDVQGLDEVGRERIGAGGVVHEAADAVAIPAGQAALGADPDKAVAILGQRHRDRVRQALFQADVFEQRCRQPLPALGRCGSRSQHGQHGRGQKA